MNSYMQELANKCHSKDGLHFDYVKFAELMIEASFDAVIADGRYHDVRRLIKSAKYVALEHFGIE